MSKFKKNLCIFLWLFFFFSLPISSWASEPEKQLARIAQPYIKYFTDRAKDQDPAFGGFTNSYLLNLGNNDPATQAVIDHGGATYDMSILARISLAAGSSAILDTFANYATPANLADPNNPVFNTAGNYYGAGGPEDKIKYGPYRMVRISGRNEGGWWNTWDWMVDTGSAACLIIDALAAYQKTSDNKYKNVAVLLGSYISKLKDADGGIRYGPRGMYHEQGADFFWNLKSTEQNERALAAFQALYAVTNDGQYNDLAEGIKSWLKNMYRKEMHLFYAAATFDGQNWVKPDIDGYVPTDVTAFAPLELMATDSFFGETQANRDAEIAAMFSAIEGKTAFLNPQSNPDFFRFSVSQSSRDYGSVEWSAQMSLAYLRAAQIYAALDWDKAQAYLAKYKLLIESLDTFFSAPADDPASKVAPYASYYANKQTAGNVPTGTGYYTFNCQAALASCYYVFAKAGYDPLKIDGGIGVMATLNLVNVPWYQNAAPYFSTAAASGQMISNFIRLGTSKPEITQNQFYEYAKGSKPKTGELNPDEISNTLGHFDPYDEIVSGWADVYDKIYADGNPYQGYNFEVESFNPATDAEAFNKYIRDICHWMAFTVTKNEWWVAGELVNQPNCPAMIPIGGTYDHWVVVKGFATSANPCPEPRTDPSKVADFTVYGLWIKDPLINGLGQDTYKTVAELKTSYLLPLNTGDNYHGKYVQVAEPPPQVPGRFKARLAGPMQDPENLTFIGVRIPSVRVSSEVRKVIKKDWKDIVDKHLLSDPKAQEAFNNTKIGRPLLVKRLDRVGANYYLVPFNKASRRNLGSTSALVMLDERKGYFKEATWTAKPEKFPRIGIKEALDLIRNYIINDQSARLKTLPREPQKTYQSRLSNLNYAYRQLTPSPDTAPPITAELCWEPKGEYSNSPYHPYWSIDINGSIWKVTQEGAVLPQAKMDELLADILRNNAAVARFYENNKQEEEVKRPAPNPVANATIKNLTRPTYNVYLPAITQASTLSQPLHIMGNFKLAKEYAKIDKNKALKILTDAANTAFSGKAEEPYQDEIVILGIQASSAIAKADGEAWPEITLSDGRITTKEFWKEQLSSSAAQANNYGPEIKKAAVELGALDLAEQIDQFSAQNND